ncbi:MAG: bifunctional homocysteine S-methyltransferase/methylenetetrahydrofolate reductase [bacterium]|nr:bifunctional homocysteine S-methyltransferase/methylenetetrahydrofolate reductase [bacterium]
MKDFREYLKANRVIIFDGAIGTELLRRGYPQDRPIEYANIINPELVLSIHKDYIDAGAECIETNTFGANEFKLKAWGYEELVEKMNKTGVKLAKEVARDNVYVFASIGPIGKPIGRGFEIDEKGVTEIFKRQIISIIEEEPDGLILETMSSTKEVEILLNLIKELSIKIPIIVQFSFSKDMSTSLGEDISKVLGFMKEINADVVGLNCGNGPLQTLEILKIFWQNLKGPFSVQPNAGYPQFIQNRLVYNTGEDYFASFVKDYIRYGAKIIGGCCGTSPKHIRTIKDALREDTEEIEIEIITSQGEKFETVRKDTASELSKKLGRKFIFSVEINPPKGIELERVKTGVKILKEAGVDAVNISDSPMARVRISPIALAHILKEELDLESILHFTCRDRNLIGLQAELLGAAALGIKNILALTGDPPSIGDHPQAKPVFDVTSEGLVMIMNRLNNGTDYMGNPIGLATNFTIGVAVNPNVEDIDKEIDKLRRKIENGVNFIQTQPIYDREILEMFLEKVSFNLPPILVGILPLRSYRHAEFLHNEVPGICIPKNIRERIGNSKDPKREGIEIALEIIKSVKSMVSGIYIVAPFEKYEIAKEIIEGFRNL